MDTKRSILLCSLIVGAALETPVAAQTQCADLIANALLSGERTNRYLAIVMPAVTEFVTRKNAGRDDLAVLSREAHAKVCPPLDQLNESEMRKAKKFQQDVRAAKCGSNAVRMADGMIAQANKPLFYCKAGLAYRDDGQQLFSVR